jgi:hypothetical protein
MNDDAWAKAQLEQLRAALARILSDVEKFSAELLDFRQRVGLGVHPGESWQQEEEEE